MYLCNAGITSNKVLITASGPNSLRVAWWVENGSMALRYTVSCSIVSDNNIEEGTHKKKVAVTFKGAINTMNFGQLLPSTRYSCCIAEHNVDSNSTSEICKEVTTFTEAVEEADSLNGTTIFLFVMVMTAVLCTSMLLVIIRKQRRDGERIANW